MMETDESMAGRFVFPWYVVHTKPRQERLALENLARQRYRTYLPHLKVLKNSRGLQQIKFEPLFPRYLFFQPGRAEQSIAPVRSTLGVNSVVRFGGVPAVLQPGTIESIRNFESRQHAANITELSALQPGKTVIVTRGPLAGLEGLIAMVSRQRVVVLMRLLGEETKVRLRADELKLVA